MNPIRKTNQTSNGSNMLTIVAVLVILVVIGTISWIYFTYQSKPRACNVQLEGQVGDKVQNVCLQPLTISVSSINSTEFSVPVLTIRPGQSGNLQLLYHISAGQVNHQGNKANLSRTDSPGALSVSTATENKSKVSFSDGSLVFQNEDWIIYQYSLTTSKGSMGYYAIIPPYYYGMYPALVVTSDPRSLNYAALSMWGYSGILQSGEFIIPSTIVAVAGIRVTNVTIPEISYCPNSACFLISRSLV